MLQLCATRKGKKFVKDKNAYVIMREYFKWERERDPTNEIAAMNVIDMLIGEHLNNTKHKMFVFFSD